MKKYRIISHSWLIQLAWKANKKMQGTQKAAPLILALDNSMIYFYYSYS